MRFKYFFIVVLLLGALKFLSAAEQIRNALVIGNSGYSGSPLKNPVNDARAMERALNQLGFKVTLATDVKNYQGMVKLIRDFGLELQKGGVGLFYYAGHGVQMAGRNYLIPTQADIRKEGDVELEAVDLDRVLNEMQYARNDINIIILDACRDNPYAATFRSSQRGLATITRSVPDCLIAFATQPNGVALDGEGNNGIFTEELLKNISTPGLSITQIMMRTRNGVRQRTQDAQLPWETNLLSDDFYLTEAPKTSQPVQTPPAEDTLSKGLVAWYPFNGNANDESGNGHHGTTFGTTLTTDRFGQRNQAYDFNGANQYIDLGDWVFGGPITISGWVKNRTYPHCSRMIDLGNGPEAQNIIVATNGGTNGIWFRSQVNSYTEPDCFVIDYPDYFTTNGWDFVTCMISTTGRMSIYKNGILMKESSNAVPPPHALRTKNYLGKSNWPWDGFFDGVMDDIRIYDRALSEDEIQQLYDRKM